jgi:hypothetical protein
MEYPFVPEHPEEKMQETTVYLYRYLLLISFKHIFIILQVLINVTSLYSIQLQCCTMAILSITGFPAVSYKQLTYVPFYSHYISCI